jgi:hypothetical protein
MHSPMREARSRGKTSFVNAFNTLESTKRLEAAGITRDHAEAIASEINAGTDDLVTKDYFSQKLDAALAKQTVRNGVVTSGIVAFATTLLGLLISLN